MNSFAEESASQERENQSLQALALNFREAQAKFCSIDDSWVGMEVKISGEHLTRISRQTRPPGTARNTPFSRSVAGASFAVAGLYSARAVVSLAKSRKTITCGLV